MLPTTRRGRFLYRRRKYLRKSKRAAAITWIRKTGVDHRQHYVGGKREIVYGPIQSPHGLRRFHGFGLIEALASPFTGWEFLPRNPTGLPHVRITDPFLLAYIAHNGHLPFAVIGFQKRRVRAMRRLFSHGQSAFQRRLNGSNFFFFMNGCYSEDDVLGRHPTGAEIDAGAAYPPATHFGWPLDGH